MIFKYSFSLAASRAASQSEATLENHGELTTILSLDSISSANPRWISEVFSVLLWIAAVAKCVLLHGVTVSMSLIC